ncbi:MAG: FMN-binding protein [Christensenellales bacterium]|jgi:Na+-translocating ferredoxin:NAD+ oxidoreductase RnfG subunit
MRKIIILIILLLTIALPLSACKEDTEDIVSLVDNPEGYAEESFEPFDTDDGSILKVFVKEDRIIVSALGTGGYNGDVKIVALIENGVILAVSGYDITEKGRGEKAFKDSFLNQFVDKNISGLDKFAGGAKPIEGVDILYVTGATYSCKAVINAVNTIVDWYNK